MFLGHVQDERFGLGAENGTPLVVREFSQHTGVVLLNCCNFLIGGFFTQGEQCPEAVRPVELAAAMNKLAEDIAKRRAGDAEQ